MKVGLIAGGGDLPKNVVAGAERSGTDISVIALDGITDPGLFPNAKSVGLAEFGKIIKILKREKVTHLTLAGLVKRPNFSSLKPDLKAMRYLPGAIKAAQVGDDALLRYLMDLFEKEGFEIIAPQDLCQSILLPEGVLTSQKIAKNHQSDLKKACEAALKIGEMDIGQGAIVCNGVVLAVEAQEGTDAMIDRVASLSETVRGTRDKRAGVLAKLVKPGQDVRVDLPTIGPMTIEKADRAGLAGIVAGAGQAFIIEQETVVNMANEAGMFIAGLPQAE